MGKHRHPLDKRTTLAYQHMRRRVLVEEPVCWLRLPGCTYKATTVDHIIPVKAAPELSLVRSNLRGACAHCNYVRQDKPLTRLASPANPITDWFN